MPDGSGGERGSGGLGERRERGGRNSRSREEINPNVLSLGMAGQPRTPMDSSPAALWVVHSGAVRFLVPSCPQPISLSQAMQTQRGGKDPCSSLACGMSRWMMICPRVLRGALCAQKVSLCPLWGTRGAPCAGLHTVMTGVNVLSLGLLLVASGLGGLAGTSPGCSRVGTTGQAHEVPRMGTCGYRSPRVPGE